MHDGHNHKSHKKWRDFFGERHTFPSFKEFEKLATPAKPSVCPKTIAHSGYVLISPFTNDMFIFEDMPKLATDINNNDDCIEELLNTYSFKELIEYVCEKNDTSNQYTKDEIKVEYIKFAKHYLTLNANYL